MFVHDKRLQSTGRVAASDSGLGNLLLEQFVGPQDELGAAGRHFTQAVSEDGRERRQTRPVIRPWTPILVRERR
ncbi:catalase [Caballeronia pedi]|uniref:Catalase n=1 Tax=Caballeronia pedi TaxID=1777141 RepID=A0A158E8G5_9BURK|nr:catalase [Caballeronia pedi]